MVQARERGEQLWAASRFSQLRRERLAVHCNAPDTITMSPDRQSRALSAGNAEIALQLRSFYRFPTTLSRDSTLILCASYKKAVVQAFSVVDLDWVCKIDESAVGLAFARWAPDSTQILCVAEFNIRLTAWSLTDRGCFQLKVRYAIRARKAHLQALRSW